MSGKDLLKLHSEILVKAKELGATLVGVANVDDLNKAPSYTVTPLMEPYSGVGANKGRMSDLIKVGEVSWPEGVKSVVVVAYAHPEDHPELDYWYGSIDPIGNKKLVEIVNGLAEWLQKNHGINAFPILYHIEKGGIYLKDAAVYAGMGCIGKNNLLLTPEYGPRVRLRALSLDIDLPSTGLAAFDPCTYCEQPCTKSCSHECFKEVVHNSFKYGREELPGRGGQYNRIICNTQMTRDEEKALEQNVPGIGESVRVVKYCRKCELSCPVGKV